MPFFTSPSWASAKEGGPEGSPFHPQQKSALAIRRHHCLFWQQGEFTPWAWKGLLDWQKIHKF
jgi:hypothetical protein